MNFPNIIILRVKGLTRGLKYIDDLLRYPCDLTRLGTGLIALWYVHVHLITVEMGIIRRCHGKVEAEGLGYQPALANKNTTVHLLEYGMSLTRWLILLILCNGGRRLKSTKSFECRSTTQPY